MLFKDDFCCDTPESHLYFFDSACCYLVIPGTDISLGDQVSHFPTRSDANTDSIVSVSCVSLLCKFGKMQHLSIFFFKKSNCRGALQPL